MFVNTEEFNQSTEKNVVPPYCNTGAQNTSQHGLNLLVDWVSATFIRANSIHEICTVLGVPFDEFIELDHGLHGYKKQMICGNIKILYEGSANMGIHIEMTGKGCREFETYYNKNWIDFFRRMLNANVKFTRIDIACDDRKGYFKIPTLVRKVKEGLCRSKFKKSRHMETINIEDGETNGTTLYFGQPSSRIKIRMYEKNHEQIADGKEVVEEIWNRTEIELKKERAELVADVIADNQIDLGKIFSGVLKNYITFVKPLKNDKNKARWPTAKFWTKFIGDVEPLKLTKQKPDRSIERIETWYDKQIEKSFAMLYHSVENPQEWILTRLLSGTDKIKEKDRNLIRDYKQKKYLHEQVNENDIKPIEI